MPRIAVIAAPETAKIFSALGLKAYPTRETAAVLEALRECHGDRIPLVFLGQAFGELLPQWEQEHPQGPAVILIPEADGSDGLALDRLHRLVEKAVGMDVLKESKP